MPKLSRPWFVCCVVVAPLLSVLLWADACTHVGTVATYAPAPRIVASATPAPMPARAPTGTALLLGMSPAPADLGCLVFQDQGADQPVWLLKGGATPRIVAYGDWARLSPDGRYVLYSRGFPAELWIVGTDGASPALVYTAPAGGPLIRDLFLAPDGTLAAFSLTCPGCPSSQDSGALWRLDLPSGEVRKLAEAGAHWPLFSPDGRWLSLASPLGTLAAHGTVGLIDVEGRGERALFDLVHVRDRTWATDSGGFVVALDEGAAQSAYTTLWWVPTSGPPTRLGELTDVLDLTWQPGGERLVYRKEEGGPSWLYLTNRDGGGEVSIPGSEGMFPRADTQLPAWSPNGRWLLAMREDGTPALLDVEAPGLRILEVQVVWGWLDADYYLASTIQGEDLDPFLQGEDMVLDLSRCSPRGQCEWLAQVPRLARLSYASRCP